MEYVVSMDEATYVRYENIIRAYEKMKLKTAQKYRDEHPTDRKRPALSDRNIKWKVIETRPISAT